ncbi:diaminopimelate decarboxylase [Ferrimonas sp. SCSIO 43195]|uniref:diaminopimelate decarboxylase n=1 Tax=Ferrimonas sp. SCSIO 43195 TaxID=2822844 RepID=UPI00207656B8|nr:diaminopimelate decarboxylase [Ferrimonas sp. SCSIO 43195]USD36613.1 diaminopimelate decarboxylase [Ferrimonas sp. SCSIO 43195]
MDYFNVDNGQLMAERVSVTEAAEAYGTPLYLYSRATIERHWQAFTDAMAGRDHLICYAVKANSNLAILNLMARLGSGFDIVSGGELARVIAAGGDATKVVFSGVGKTEAEMEYALKAGIHCFNLESEPELERLQQVAARLGLVAPVSLRINPDIDANSHPYISTGLKQNKFGIPTSQALPVYRRAAAMDHIQVLGMDCHIGSQLTESRPFVEALERLLALMDTLAEEGIELAHLDLGGGLGVSYGQETPPLPTEYVQALLPTLGQRKLKLILEPGRAIMANAGILVTKVEYLKQGEDRDFAIVDAAMNDLLRPSLYNAWQEIVPVTASPASPRAYDVVGPVCETGDFLGKNRKLAIAAGDYLAVRGAGAYGFTMSSNYNSRPRAAEVMADGDRMHLIREREQPEQLWRGEHCLPEA